MSTGAIFERILIRFGWKFLRRREFVTTETEESAIASQASSGFSTRPIPASVPAATGIPRTL